MKLLRTIRNCTVRIPMPCPQDWQTLTELGTPTVRHCDMCNKDVHLCLTDAETLEHARAGHCIAREVADRSELPEMVLGRPSVAPVISPEQREAQARNAREREIDDVLAWDLSAYDRFCPNCGYPVPNFRPCCRVCGTTLGRIKSTR